MQAYQNGLRDLIVEHKNRSIRKISLKNRHIWLKWSCTTHQLKNRSGWSSPNWNKVIQNWIVESALVCWV